MAYEVGQIIEPKFDIPTAQKPGGSPYGRIGPGAPGKVIGQKWVGGKLYLDISQTDWGGGTGWTLAPEHAGGPSPALAGGAPAQPTGDINQFLGKYQEEIMSSITQKPEVRTRTPEEIRAMLEPSVGLPSPIDYGEMFKGFREEYGVSDLEEALTGLKAEEDELYAAFRQQKTAERGKAVAMGVIEGRIGEEERAYLERADYLGRQKSRITDELNTKYTLIGQLMGFERMTYQDTVERYESEFNRNITMYDIIRGEERDALSDWERAVDRAKSNLQIFSNAITAGNLSYDALDESQKVFIAKLEAQSGLPIGFISSLKMSMSDRLVSVNEKTGEALMIGENGQFQVVQTGMRPTPTTGTAGDRADARMSERFERDATTIMPIDTAEGTIGIFAQMVQRYAGEMTLSEIYDAYMKSKVGQEYGYPTEDPTNMADLYEMYR